MRIGEYENALEEKCSFPEQEQRGQRKREDSETKIALHRDFISLPSKY